MPFLIAAAVLVAVLAHGTHVSKAAPGTDVATFTFGSENGPTAQAGWAGAPFTPLSFPGIPDPSVAVRLPILMYHHVKEPAAGDSELTRGLSVGPAAFETQMIYLQQQGYHSVNMRQLFEALYYGKPLPDKAVMLTFDDGYADNYAVAAPILRKYGFTGTFYIVTDLVGAEGYMNWDQVRDLETMGMEIGSHTASHPDLTLLSIDRLQQELAGSAAVLGQQIGHPVYWFCYPAGAFDKNVLEQVWGAGYLTALTTLPGEIQLSDHTLTLPRWRLGPGTTLEQFAFLVG